MCGVKIEVFNDSELNKETSICIFCKRGPCPLFDIIATGTIKVKIFWSLKISMRTLRSHIQRFIISWWLSNSKLHLNIRKPMKALQPMGTILSVTLVMIVLMPGVTFETSQSQTDKSSQVRSRVEKRENEEYMWPALWKGVS